MDRLADMIESAIKSAGARNVRQLLDSPAWQEVLLRYDTIHLELLVQGHKDLAEPLDACFRQLENGMVEMAQQADPPKLTDVFLFWDMRLCSKLRAMAQVSKQIAANSPVKPKDVTVAAKAGGREKRAATPKRSWIAPELNDAIREYVAQRSKRYQEFSSILDSPNESAKRKRTAKREARKMFGRNVIAEALGVKSARMVSESSAWMAVAAALGFTLKRDQIGKSEGSPKKIGLDIAVEKAAVRNHAAAVDASDEGLSGLAERSSTTRLIHQYSESGLPDAATMAAALLEKYKDGEMTDKQVRDTISTLKSSV